MLSHTLLSQCRSFQGPSRSSSRSFKRSIVHFAPILGQSHANLQLIPVHISRCFPLAGRSTVFLCPQGQLTPLWTQDPLNSQQRQSTMPLFYLFSHVSPVQYQSLTQLEFQLFKLLSHLDCNDYLHQRLCPQKLTNSVIPSSPVTHPLLKL
jgi:hypothetical protein